MPYLKLIIFLISTSAFGFPQRDLLPTEYRFLATSVEDSQDKIIQIETSKNELLSFVFIKEECDQYIDNCFLTFESLNGSDFMLFGLEVCTSNKCSDSHPLFPNFRFVLREL